LPPRGRAAIKPHGFPGSACRVEHDRRSRAGARPVTAGIFGEAPKILSASKHELLRVRNIGEDTAENIANWEKSVDLAGELKRIADYGCHVLISSDENYPTSLREIYDPPLVNGVPIYTNCWSRRRSTHLSAFAVDVGSLAWLNSSS
jgi:hypothetical protein